MRSTSFCTVAALAATTQAGSNSSTLTSLCTVSNVQAALPADGTLLGIDLLPSTVTAVALYNVSSGTGGSYATYCNVTFSYLHTGTDYEVEVKYAFPDPSDYSNRFYLAGGEGYSISTDATGGLDYGAVGGATSAGYDAMNGNPYDDAVLYGNGSINWDATYMFAYQALGELTVIGKAITPGFYGVDSDIKIHTYFEGCSDGGREGMSQVQRWGELYDGVIAGAPAFRMAQQQVNHVFSSVVEHTLDYYPPPCELAKIVNATIAACDPLDGRTDGVVSRTDLCMLEFNISSIIGEAYYCAATTSSSLGFGFDKRAAGSTTSSTPAQNGTVSMEGVAVAQTILNGLHNSKGERAYLSWQISASFGDAGTTYNNDTDSYELDIPTTGGEFVTKFIKLVDIDNLSSLDNVTYDTLVDWMEIAFVRYYDSLQTTLPDLNAFQSSGGKLLQYHGESDPSIPTASSVHYWQAVRAVMYPNATEEESLEALQDWYQLYLVPGAGHCGSNSLQPGPYPADNMKTMIDWVENGIKPTGLNATYSTGTYEGQTDLLCQWPTRPLWTSNSSTYDCVNDTASIESWTYSFPAFLTPVY